MAPKVPQGAITDEKTERAINDAAHVLLDLCRAACTPAGDDEAARAKLTSQTLSIATQALFMADHLRPGQGLQERILGSGINGQEIATLSYGLGVGLGMCIGSVQDPLGFSIAYKGAISGIGDALKQKRGG